MAGMSWGLSNYMRDEFPEQGPNEMTRLHCLRGQKKVCLHCFEIDEEVFEFSEVAKGLKSAEFLKTQRERFEDPEAGPQSAEGEDETETAEEEEEEEGADEGVLG